MKTGPGVSGLDANETKAIETQTNNRPTRCERKGHTIETSSLATLATLFQDIYFTYSFFSLAASLLAKSGFVKYI